jgi:hypothetical protein
MTDVISPRAIAIHIVQRDEIAFAAELLSNVFERVDRAFDLFLRARSRSG